MRKKVSFRKGFLIYILVLVGLFSAALAVLWFCLRDYQARCDRQAELQAAEDARLAEEQAQLQAEKEAPQRALEQYLAEMTPESWRDCWLAVHPDSPEDRSALLDYFEACTSPESLTAYKDESWTEENPVYLLRSDGADFAKITPEGVGLTREIAGPEFLLEGSCSGRLETLSCCSVLCNGVLLDDTYLVSSESIGPAPDYAEETGLARVVYEVSGLLLEPVLTEQAPEGAQLVYSEADGGLVLPDLSSEAEAAADRGAEFVKAVLDYYMSGGENTAGNLNGCISFAAAGSKAYERLMDSYDGVSWNPTYSSPTVTVSAGQPISWGETYTSVDIGFDAACSYNGSPIDYAEGTYRLIFCREGTTLSLVDFLYQ